MPRPERGAYDFETWDWTKPLACGLLFGPKGAREWEWIHDKSGKRPSTIAPLVLRAMATLADNGGPREWWAHNGGKFDSNLLLEGIVSLGWRASGAVAGGRLVSLNVYPTGGRAFQLRDSMAVVASSLRRAAEDFGLEQKKTFQKGDYAVDMRKMPHAQLEAGCRADCEVVLQLLDAVETLAVNWGGQLKLTAASTAFSCVTSRVKLPDLREWPGANELARVAYMGGRVEVFHHCPKGLLCELDVTSSYPWSMSGALPFQPLGPASPAQLRDMMREKGKTDGVVRAKVEVPASEWLPALPWVHPDGGIFFPTGAWEAWFQACELRYAVSLGYKVRPIEGWAYTREAPFREFVEEVVRHKARSVGAQRAFAKLVANSSYGKLGEHPDRENLMLFPSEEAAAEYIEESPEDSCRILDEGGSLRFLARAIFRWPAHTHYAAAGAVTAKSRVLLHRDMTRATALAYTDTDSLHCGLASLKTLRRRLGGGLGELKVEVAKMRARFYAPKLYELHPAGGKGHYASKGFPVDAKTFRRVVRGETIITSRPRLVKRQFRKGGRAAVDDMARSWSGRSMKRRPFPNGETEPWSVADLEADQHLEARSPLAR